MRCLSLATVLALGAMGVASAQVNATGTAQVNNSDHNPNSSVTQPGIAKPPAGMPTQPSHSQQLPGTPPNMANNPTLPQVALQPSATVGSPVPIAGPGGTTSTATGNNQQTFTITRLFRRFFEMF